MTPNWDVQVNSFDTAPSLRGAKGPGGAAEGGAKGIFRSIDLNIQIWGHFRVIFLKFKKQGVPGGPLHTHP